MAAYGKGIKYDKAVATLEQFIASGERPDTDKYNVLIDACIRAERPGHVTKWLAAMKERRVPFDSITFNMVIGAYAGRGDVRATEFTYRKVSAGWSLWFVFSEESSTGVGCRGFLDVEIFAETVGVIMLAHVSAPLESL